MLDAELRSSCTGVRRWGARDRRHLSHRDTNSESNARRVSWNSFGPFVGIGAGHGLWVAAQWSIGPEIRFVSVAASRMRALVLRGVYVVTMPTIALMLTLH